MTALRPDLAAIAAAVPHGARVLDVGCGDGALLAALRAEKGVDGRGIELSGANVAAAV
ncbi:MAG: methyltransferase domain-containing protein, partial [Sphingomonadaceae bacterium]|nr:methyltransferase domain-containing protein [Sphingomonadaceae bacterium]